MEFWIMDVEWIPPNHVPIFNSMAHSQGRNVLQQKVSDFGMPFLKIIIDGSVFLPWCGFLINTVTFEVQNDYTRLIGDCICARLFRHKLTMQRYQRSSCCKLLEVPWCCIERETSEFCSIQVLPPITARWKYHCTQSKHVTSDCHQDINSPLVVRLNVYQSFLMCAMRFYCLVKALPNGPDHNPGFFLGIISYVHDRITVSSICRNYFGFGWVCAPYHQPSSERRHRAQNGLFV